MARIKCTLAKEDHEKEDRKNCHAREWAKRAATRAKRSAEAAKTAQNLTSTPTPLGTILQEVKHLANSWQQKPH